jgi:hypothetical protein
MPQNRLQGDLKLKSKIVKLIGFAETVKTGWTMYF